MTYLKYGWYVMAGIVLTGYTIYKVSRYYVKPIDILELVLGYEERYYATYRTNEKWYVVSSGSNQYTNVLDSYVRKSLITNLDCRIKRYLSGRYFVSNFVFNPTLISIESNLPLIFLTNDFNVDFFITSISTMHYLSITQQGVPPTNYLYITNEVIITNVYNVSAGTNYISKEYLFYIYSNLYPLQYATITNLNLCSGSYYEVLAYLKVSKFYDSPEYEGAFTSVIDMIITGFSFRNLNIDSDCRDYMHDIHNTAYNTSLNYSNYTYNTNIYQVSYPVGCLGRIFEANYSFVKQSSLNIASLNGYPSYNSSVFPRENIASNYNSVLDVEVYNSLQGWLNWGSVYFNYSYPVHAFVSLAVNNIYNPTFAANWNEWVGQSFEHSIVFKSYTFYLNKPNYFDNEFYITRLQYNNPIENTFLRFSIFGVILLANGNIYTNYYNPYYYFNFGGLGAFQSPTLFFSDPPHTNETSDFKIKAEYLHIPSFEYCIEPLTNN